MKIFGVTVPSPKELEEKTRKVMEACERYQRGECDCTASSALTQCEVDALLAGCVDECGGDDLEEGVGAIGQSHNAGAEPFGYYCHACDGFTTQKEHAELHWSALGYIPLYRHSLGPTSEESCMRLRVFEIGRSIEGGELDDETAISLGKELVALSRVCQACHGEGIEGDEPDANGEGGGIGPCSKCNGSRLVMPAKKTESQRVFR